MKMILVLAVLVILGLSVAVVVLSNKLTKSNDDLELWQTRYVYYNAPDSYCERYNDGIVCYSVANSSQFKVSTNAEFLLCSNYFSTFSNELI